MNPDIEQAANVNDDPGFFYRPGTIKWILRGFYSICLFLFVLDFFVHRHIETSIEKLPAFYAIYGFVACVLLVLIASQMRKWLMRGEHYYEADNKQVIQKDNNKQ